MNHCIEYQTFNDDCVNSLFPNNEMKYCGRKDSRLSRCLVQLIIDQNEFDKPLELLEIGPALLDPNQYQELINLGLVNYSSIDNDFQIVERNKLLDQNCIMGNWTDIGTHKFNETGLASKFEVIILENMNMISLGVELKDRKMFEYSLLKRTFDSLNDNGSLIIVRNGTRYSGSSFDFGRDTYFLFEILNWRGEITRTSHPSIGNYEVATIIKKTTDF